MKKNTILLILLLSAAPAMVFANTIPSASFSILDNGKGFSKALVQKPTGSPAKTFSNSNFSEIEVGGNLHVIIEKGSKHSISAYGESLDIDQLEVKQDGNQLTLGWKNDKEYNHNRNNSNRKVVLLIQTPSLREAEVGGAALAMVQGFNENEFTIEASGASQVQLDITCKTLKLEANGASKLETIGKATKLQADINGASQVRAKNLSCQDVDVAANGASQAHVSASGNLNVNANGASKVEYSGNPKNVNQETHGGSKVSKV